MAQNTIIGVFPSEMEAHEVAEDLKKEGFPEKKIHLDKEAIRTQSWFARLLGVKQENDALAYREALRQGRAVVAVDLEEDKDEKLRQAADIMDRHNPIDVAEELQDAQSPDLTEESAAPASEIPAPRTEAAEPVQASAEQRLPVMEEQIGVTKRLVLHGGVRVYTHVEEKPVEEEVQSREEEATVERHPVEDPVVSKTARVVEEVVISKERTERTEKVRDAIRRTDVRVEPLTAEMRTETTAIPADIAVDFRKNFETQYPGRSYAEYEKAYCAGYRAAHEPIFRGKDFRDVEDQLKKEFSRTFPRGDWQQMRNAVRYGWERGSVKV